MPEKSRSQRMRSIEQLADRRGRDLAVQLSEQAGRVQGAVAKLDDLRAYLDESSDSAAGAAVSPRQLAESQHFRQRLRDVIKLQEEMVRESQAAYEALRSRWIAAHTRTSALTSAVDKFLLEEQRVRTTAERKAEDELAAALCSRKPKLI